MEIYPEEPTLKVGQALTLTCEINHPNLISAVDIQWSHDGEPLSSELYSALDTKRSRLVIPRAGFQDSGVYACNTEKSAQLGSNSTEVNIGGGLIILVFIVYICLLNQIFVLASNGSEQNPLLEGKHVL